MLGGAYFIHRQHFFDRKLHFRYGHIGLDRVRQQASAHPNAINMDPEMARHLLDLPARLPAEDRARPARGQEAAFRIPGEAADAVQGQATMVAAAQPVPKADLTLRGDRREGSGWGDGQASGRPQRSGDLRREELQAAARRRPRDVDPPRWLAALR